ncbi:MAG: MBOAT family protein [Chlorobiaceae bacterium]|nr:MBOAT family protein [Chlorobiaceae bacterium]
MMPFSIDSEALVGQLLYDPRNPLLFNNGFFVFFFTVFISLYYLFRNYYLVRTAILSAFSLYFFYKASGAFVILVIISAVADYVLSNLIYRQQRRWVKRLLLVGSIMANLGLLFYFKYTNFFIEVWNGLGNAGIHPLNILLPVGISFYTFENLSYTVDVYLGKIEPERRFLNYLLFLSFFPKLVMGPIVRASDFIPQLKQPYRVSDRDFSDGFYLIISGLFKKVVISDFITANYVNYIFDAPTLHTGLECLLAVYGYAIVIYCDFSGYSDVAIGLAKWLGISIPVNFNSPYQSTSITEFWHRWHISLSSWLRDYLYIPLGGNRRGQVRTYVNLFITMLLGGLWHGASWNFVAWGALHGVGLAVHKIWRGFRNGERTVAPALSRFLAGLFTFHFVCLGWIFFKASSFDVAYEMLRQITTGLTLDGLEPFLVNYGPALLMIALGFLLHLIPARASESLRTRLGSMPLMANVAVFMAFVAVYAYFKSSEPIMPIYLQF